MTLDLGPDTRRRRGRRRETGRRSVAASDGVPERASSGRLRRYAPIPLLVLASAVVALDLDLPVVRPLLALVTLLGVPTLVLDRRAGFPADSAAARLLYAFGTSLLGLVVGGLLLDVTLPLVGVEHPLAPPVLATAWLLVDLALLAWRRSVPLLPPRFWGHAVPRVLGARWELAQALAGAATLLAVLGAVRLNNGAGGGVALVSQVLAGAALLALLLGPPRTLGRDARTLTLVAASLLLATSLRGWHITGHDIQAEFLVFRLTNDAQHWQMSTLQSAYNACLSVNILPTVLAQTTGLSGEVVFKVLLQLVFATVPVLTLLFARRYLPHRLALVAAIFTMAFPTFFTDMPYLVRQEIAFFFLALLVLAATEPRRARVGTPALVAILGVGVVLSHYSTTYVMLMALVLALAALSLTKVVRRTLPRLGRAAPTAAPSLVLLNPVMVMFLVAATLAWAGPVTHTGAHASSVVRETWAALSGKGTEGPRSSDTSYWLLSHDRTTPRERMNLFVKDTLRYRAQEIPPEERLVPHPGPQELRPRILPVETAPLTALGRGLDSVGIDPVTLNKAAKLGCAALLQVFLLLGLVWLVRRRSSPPAGPRRDGGPQPSAGEQDGFRPTREATFLTIGAVASLALIVLVPNLSVDYGVLRAFQQTLLVVAPVMAVGMGVVLRPLAGRAAWLPALVPVALLLVLSGVVPSFVGGQQERIALANSGPYYDRFFYSDSEARAQSWLAAVDHADTTNERIIANRNVNVRLLAATGNRAPVADRLYPTLLTKHSYVFVDGQIIDRGGSTIFYTGDLLTYAYPLRDLDRRLDLVYSSPRTRIYR